MIFNLSEDLTEELNQITGQNFGLPNKCGSYRVARGGSASAPAKSCRVSVRNQTIPDYDIYIGLRIDL